MEKLTALGTGNALATKCYNTCFTIETEQGVLLVDAGGGNGILSQLKKAGYAWTQVRHVIVTHEHCDHILGMVWVVRAIGTLIKQDKYEGSLHIWCHSALVETIKTLARLTLEAKFVDLFDNRIIIHGVVDGEKADMLGREVTFFDIHSSKAIQYGFTMGLKSGKKLTCLGDEPYNPLCADYISGTDILLCEAFCMYADRDIFKPYEKHHSTVSDACILAEDMKIKQLVLWHTEDGSYELRKEKYIAEGREYYNGTLYVPYDLEEIYL